MASLEKLSYQVIGCSGFDDDFPPEELLMDQQTPGWCSERWREFNSGLCRIQKLQLLVHHYKIASRIELFVSKDKRQSYELEDLEEVTFLRIGYISLNDNQANGFRARELKTIHIDTEATLVKILVHKCFVNALNLYNQVGFISINYYGKVLELTRQNHTILDPFKDYDDPKWQSSEAIVRGLMGKSTVDAKTEGQSMFSVTYDKEMTDMLGAIERAKHEAVKTDEFHQAKILKKLYDACKDSGGMIARMIAQKHEAVKVEDFDRAEAIKTEIETIKESFKRQIIASGFRIDRLGELEYVNDYGHRLHDPKDPLPEPATSEPDPLLLEQKTQFAAAIKLFGKDIVTRIVSRELAFREQGLEKALAVVDEYTKDTQDLTEATMQLIDFTIDTAVDKVALLTVYLWNSLLQKWKETTFNFVHYCDASFPKLVLKCAEGSRIKTAALDLIMGLSALYHSNTGSVLPLIFNVSILHATTKQIKSTLDILLKFLNKYGIEVDRGDNGLSRSRVAAFIEPFMEHKDPDVQKYAWEVASYLEEMKKYKKPIKPLPTQEQVCIFCGEADPDFDEKSLDKHYWDSCAMLTKCELCKLVVEVSSYSSHLKHECEFKQDSSTCYTCKENFVPSVIKFHQSKCKPKKGLICCPLCSDNVADLKEHLVARGCPQNPRNPS